MNIRPAALNELDAVYEASRKSGYPFPQYAFSRQEISEMLEKETVLVAEEYGTIMGYASLRQSFENNAETCELYSLEVKREFHGRGVGSKLAREAEKLARNEGKKRICARVHERNRPALVFYKKHGYAVVKKVLKYYSGGEASLVVCKTLASGQA